MGKRAAVIHMIRFLGLFLLLLLVIKSYGQEQIDGSKIGNHPRLMLLQGQEEAIKKAIAENPVWAKAHQQIIGECDEMLALPKLERVLVGMRLLDKSRECLRRVFFLAYAWRITAKKKYFKKCEETLLEVSRFTDWNPDHFLDVAEMTTAVAIGYDWLYNDLPPTSREMIRKAILTKGLEPSLNAKYNSWLTRTNNWNQVCNTGMTFGALAVYEDKPELAAKIVNRSLTSIKLSMSVYAPHGNYPEGYNYWAYGTSYNVMFLSAIEKLFGTDYGLSKLPGFMDTAKFYENLETPAGFGFNYGDAGGASQNGLEPAMFWFANKLKDPGLLFSERDNLIKSETLPVKWNRFLPAILLWGTAVDLKAITVPNYNLWAGKGENEVAMMRTSWNDPNAIFVGLKAGSPAASHGHMDVGSFVMEAEGVRWSTDLGMQEYSSLESKGIKLWDGAQNGGRWTVFRFNNFSHSTLTVNNGLQVAKGSASIKASASDSTFLNAVTDLSEVYAGSLKSSKRGIAIVNKKYVMVRDEIETGDLPCVVRWAMLTPATIAEAGNGQVLLTNKGKKLALYVHGAAEAVIKTWPTDPPNSWDVLNVGVTLVGYEITIPPHTKKEITVFLLPGEQQLAIKKSSLKPLAQW